MSIEADKALVLHEDALRHISGTQSSETLQSIGIGLRPRCLPRKDVIVCHASQVLVDGPRTAKVPFRKDFLSPSAIRNMGYERGN